MSKFSALKSGYCLFLLAVLLLSCALSAAGCGPLGDKKDAKIEADAKFVPSHPSFITAQELHSYLSFPKEKNYELNGQIISAVVPHHLVAGRLIAGVMRELAVQDPALLVIVGPNHANKGGRIITGYNAWQTPYGMVAVDQDAVSCLLKTGTAVINEEILASEHSIGALVPFVRYFLPQAKIVPVILHHGVSLAEVKRLLQVLKPYLDHDAVLISSVDFSHYLTRSEAQAKDQETLRYMQNFDYLTLMRLGNDYLDSPVALAAAFLRAQGKGINDFTILENTNSGLLLQNDFIETTSYFTLVFTEEAK